MMTEAEQASILTPEQRRRPEPLPPWDYEPTSLIAAHAASEWDDPPEPPMTPAEVYVRAAIFCLSLACVLSLGAVVLRAVSRFFSAWGGV